MPEYKKIIKSHQQEELLPLPKSILVYTLFGYLYGEDDIYLAAEIANHPQFKSLDSYQYVRENLKQRLWKNIACGEQKEALQIIKNIPSLLLEKYSVEDFSKRQIQLVTPLQLAWYAEDVEIVKEIIPYLKQLKPSNEILLEIDGRMGELESKEPSYNYFIPFTKAISENNDPEAASEKLKEDFFAENPIMNHRGKHFDVRHLANAHKIYHKNYRRWNKRQRSLFWRRGIGFMQKQLPANYANNFNLGFYGASKIKKPLRRSLMLNHNTHFYDAAMGVDHAAYYGSAGEYSFEATAKLTPCYALLKLRKLKIKKLEAIKLELKSQLKLEHANCHLERSERSSYKHC